MNIFKPIECEHCVHEYAPANCPCCEQCEVKKRNPKGFLGVISKSSKDDDAEKGI